jgi:acyl carrier protein
MGRKIGDRGIAVAFRSGGGLRCHIVTVRITWSVRETACSCTADGWDEQFEFIVRGHLPFLSAGEPLDPGQDLRAAGLDSLGAVDLLVALESAYGVRLAAEAMSMDMFATPAALWNTLRRPAASPSEPPATSMGERKASDQQP